MNRQGSLKAKIIRSFLAFVLAAVLLPSASSASTLRFCVLANHMPMSSELGEKGIDVALARKLAATLQREASIVWLAAAPGNFEEALSAGRCDVVPSALADPGTLAGPPLADVALTRPYYSAAYWLVRRADAAPVRSLQESGSSRLAVEGDSVVAYTLRHRGRRVQIMFNAKSIISSVAGGEVDYGYLWAPIAAWHLRDRQDVVLAPEFQPEDRWDFAMAVRQDRPELLRELDAGLEKLIAQGEVETLFKRHSLPYLVPKQSSGQVTGLESGAARGEEVGR